MTETPNDPAETPTDPETPRPDLPAEGDGAEMGETEGGSTFEPEEDPEGHDDAEPTA